MGTCGFILFTAGAFLSARAVMNLLQNAPDMIGTVRTYLSDLTDILQLP